MVLNNFVYDSDNQKVYFPDTHIMVNKNDKIVKRFIRVCNDYVSNGWEPSRGMRHIPDGCDLIKSVFFTS